MSTLTQYIDGDFSVARLISRTPREYPFAQNGDLTTAMFTGTYLVDQASYVPAARGSVDPLNAGFYLIAETKPEIFQGDLATFTRTYCMVPLQQIVPGSRFINKPAISGTFPQVIGSSYVTQPDPSVSSWQFYTRKTVTADTGAAGNLPTGGTYTITFGANTTSGIAYNADAATVQAAINALASVIAYGAVTVTGSYTAGFVITWNGYALVTAAVGSTVAANATVRSIVSTDAAGVNQRVWINSTWNDAGFSATSSFTPAGANPMYYFGGQGGFFQFGRYHASFGNVLPTAGTFTLTLYGQTTAAIAYNASIATMQSAINALSNVSARGGVTLVAPYGEAIEAPLYQAQLPSPALTSGTFTLTVLGQTTAAIAYNASTATIASAINALSNVTARGGVTVSGSGFSGGQQDFTITFANIPAMTTNGASLTPTEADSFISRTDSSGRVNALSFSVGASTSRTLVSPAHGIVASDSIIVQGTSVAGGLGNFAVPDADTIQLLSGSGLLNTAGTFTFVGKKSGSYVAGPKLTRIKRITDFYLPGVTSGIATADDITLPEYEGDDASLLAAIFAQETSINFEVGELYQWRESPILARTVTTINAAIL